MKQSDRELIDQVKEWFSLDKYRPATEFGPAEWAEQISKRAIINNALTVQDETLRDSFKPFLENAIPKLMEDPLSYSGFGYKNRPNAVDVPTYSTPTMLPLFDRLMLLKYKHQPEEETFKAIGRLILRIAEHQSEENESKDSNEDADLLMSLKDESQVGLKERPKRYSRDPWVRTFINIETAVMVAYLDDFYISSQCPVSRLRNGKEINVRRIMHLLRKPNDWREVWGRVWNWLLPPHRMNGYS